MVTLDLDQSEVRIQITWSLLANVRRVLPVTKPCPPDNVQFADVGHLLQVLVVLLRAGLQAEQVLPAVTRLKQ